MYVCALFRTKVDGNHRKDWDKRSVFSSFYETLPVTYSAKFLEVLYCNTSILVFGRNVNLCGLGYCDFKGNEEGIIFITEMHYLALLVFPCQ